MDGHYSVPECFPPIGLSDHNTVILKPKLRSQNQQTRKSVTFRDIKEGNKLCLGRYFNGIDWSCLSNKSTCEEKSNLFTDLVAIGLENIVPEKTIKVYPKDAPWMSVKLKKLIHQRQVAFHSNRNSLSYKFYRNAVNKERKRCKAVYYTSKVRDLKGVNQRKWWNEIKKLSGTKKDNSSLLCSLNVPQYNNMSHPEIANDINQALLEPLQVFEPLDRESTAAVLPLEENPEFLEVPVYRVYNILRHLDKHKATGPDGVPNWLLKENAEFFAQPITDIINTSFKEQKLPTTWKLADITPLPKVKQVIDPKKELRPISLTSVISKIAEDFVVSDYIKPAVEKMADRNQFGTISGSSTVLALLSMVHQWLEATDGDGSAIRVILFDYRKAFDLIDHGILVTKLKKLDLPNSIINWIIDFLLDRFQRVKLSKDCFSDWRKVPSGVPQGTKLGPWLFLLMINDLSVSKIFNMWKYVDDTTVSESIPKGQQSQIQHAVDQVNQWSQENLLQLNCEKTKEMIISFRRHLPCFPPSQIDGNPIERTTSVKLLGLIINNKLTWNDHVEELVKKSSRKLYFLVQLKRAQVKSEDLVLYYCACIRSTLDYACPVFHNSLPTYLQDELERIQKRALTCIFPGISYSEALTLAGISSIKDHHSVITQKLFQIISEDPKNKIFHLIPSTNKNSKYNLRKNRIYSLPLVRTNRFSNSFIISNATKALYA